MPLHDRALATAGISPSAMPSSWYRRVERDAVPAPDAREVLGATRFARRYLCQGLSVYAISDITAAFAEACP